MSISVCITAPSASERGAELPQAEKRSYIQILKSSALIGGSQFINILVGIFRTKAIAMLLGPGGVGLTGLYNSVIDLTQNIAGIGINSSGVRQIAEAVSAEDENRVAVTITVVRRIALFLGVLGAFALLALSRPISTLTFGTNRYALGVSILSIAAFCKLVSGGQAALIQGMRRIGDLAMMTIVGSVTGAVVGVSLVYAFRSNGIVPYLVCITGLSALISWWYSRRVRIPKVSVGFPQLAQEVAALLKLGVAFMISSLVSLGVAYATRVAVLRKVGIEATGLYQSAWTIGGMYVSFILQAMAADFYPRLTACVNDHESCNRLVNEQARVGILLGGPGVIATLTFAPVVIALLYSARFGGSVPVLRWICLGAMLQVITWPMGFIIVAKGKQNQFIFSEVAWAIASLGLTWLCVDRFGINGAGIAFFLSYVFHGVLVYMIARSLSDFRWSSENVRDGLLFLSIMAILFLMLFFTSQLAAIIFGVVSVVFTTMYSIRSLLKSVYVDVSSNRLRQVLNALRPHERRHAIAE